MVPNQTGEPGAGAFVVPRSHCFAERPFPVDRMSLQIVPFESALVGIERFDTAAHAALGAVLARMQSVFPPAVGGACAVVTNRSTSAIEVLVMRWSGDAFRKPKNIVHALRDDRATRTVADRPIDEPPVSTVVTDAD